MQHKAFIHILSFLKKLYISEINRIRWKKKKGHSNLRSSFNFNWNFFSSQDSLVRRREYGIVEHFILLRE